MGRCTSDHVFFPAEDLSLARNFHFYPSVLVSDLALRAIVDHCSPHFRHTLLTEMHISLEMFGSGRRLKFWILYLFWLNYKPLFEKGADPPSPTLNSTLGEERKPDSSERRKY